MSNNEKKEEIILHENDRLVILPETDRLNLGCCSCGACHHIDIKHKGKNVYLIFKSN